MHQEFPWKCVYDAHKAAKTERYYMLEELSGWVMMEVTGQDWKRPSQTFGFICLICDVEAAENAYPRPRGERSHLSLTGHSVFDLANLVSGFPGHQRSQIGDSMKQSLYVKQKICQTACIHRSCVPRYWKYKELTEAHTVANSITFLEGPDIRYWNYFIWQNIWFIDRCWEV